MKKIFIINLLLFCAINAQDLHEFSLHLGGGLSTLSYDPTLGDQSSGLNKQFGIGYTFFVSPRFGFATGLELAFYSAEYELKKLEMAYITRDLTLGQNFEFRSTLSSYKEEQSVAALQLPLMLQFQTEMGFYAMAGIKYSIPISSSASGKGDLRNSGCYSGFPGCFSDTLHFRGFGDFPDRKSESHGKFDNSLFGSAEMGMKWRFEDGISLYTGVYFDYGFSNILKKKKLDDLTRMVEYNPENPTNFGMNGVFNSKWEQNQAPQAFVTEVMPLAIGVKVKLSLSQGVDYFGNKEKEKQKAGLEAKQLEADRRQLELDLARATTAEKALLERETERLAAAEKLLQDARLAYEKALAEQLAARASTSEEVERLAAETAQIQDEVTRLSSPQDFPEFEPVGSDASEVEPEEQSHSGQWVVQVAVVMQKSRAGAITKSLKRKGFTAYYKQVVNPGKLVGTYYRVRVGYFPKMRDAQDFAKANLQSYKDWWLDKTDNDTK